MSFELITKLTMPKWGLSMREGVLVEWLVEQGAELQLGSDVAEVETEKINGIVESPVTGKLRRLVGKVGETMPVGSLLGVIADDSVPDAEIDAYIEEFHSSFVLEEAEEDSSPTSLSVEVGGRSLRYARYGGGDETLVLLHGFGGDLNNWLFNVDALSTGRTVLALDLPGHGGSSKEIDDGSIDEFVTALRGFLDTVGGTERVHLTGHSLGGAVAGAFAVEHPQRVASLTLIGSAGFGEEIDGEFIEGFINATTRRELKPHLERLFADDSVVTRQLVDDVLKFKRIDGANQALRTIADAAFPAGRQAVRIDEISRSIPTLVIWGREDRIIPPSHAAAAPEHARVELLERQGHSPHMEASGEVNRLIEALISSHSSPA